jgi:hypothetical protein
MFPLEQTIRCHNVEEFNVTNAYCYRQQNVDLWGLGHLQTDSLYLNRFYNGSHSTLPGPSTFSDKERIMFSLCSVLDKF